jgi:hypothetical protein
MANDEKTQTKLIEITIGIAPLIIAAKMIGNLLSERRQERRAH